jgi:hypothetical protein
VFITGLSRKELQMNTRIRYCILIAMGSDGTVSQSLEAGLQYAAMRNLDLRLSLDASRSRSALSISSADKGCGVVVRWVTFARAIATWRRVEHS